MPFLYYEQRFQSSALPARSIAVTRTDDHLGVWGGADAPVTLAPAKAVSGWSKTDANTASGTLAAGHGLTSGKYDVYWTESGTQKIRYGVDGTIAVNALALDGGAGDDFATSPTTPVVCKQTQVKANIDGDAVSMLQATIDYGGQAATGRGHIAFQEADGTPVGVLPVGGLPAAAITACLDVEGGQANPLAGNPIALAQVTHNDTAYTPTFEMLSLEDSTA